ncbi:MAG: hypothetical protein ACRDH6_03145 [Actinomycetota bacterium]
MDARDCSWCGSAKSVERGVCQVCLMRFRESEETVVDLSDPSSEKAEKGPIQPAVGD